MANERNAGRKPKLTEDRLDEIRKRRRAGESITAMAAEYGISRQALYKRLKDTSLPAETRFDYMVDGELCTTVYLDRKSQQLRVINYTYLLSKRAFGYNDSPGLKDLTELIKDEYLKSRGLTEPGMLLMLDEREPDIASGLASADNRDGLFLVRAEGELIPEFHFSKDERVIRRTDTDGFQMKALTGDRKYFVKSQALIGGLAMRDHRVEVIASDICRQLSIPCVDQRLCRFIYEGRSFEGVYSKNFELDGYTFVSFESLLARRNKSSDEREFISLDAPDKLKWCAKELSAAGDIPYDMTLKYMLDLAVIDCLIGNIDRHTRNFGLFFNVNTGRYEIPLLFDNGMGLFENDPYRDSYKSFDEAMNYVYVSPYGEDPFDMLDMLDKEYDLAGIYPGIRELVYPDLLTTPFALEYERRIMKLWRK